jgi:hypothetical protein
MARRVHAPTVNVPSALHRRGPTVNVPRDDGVERLIKEARESPDFFHNLVWDTEKAILNIDYLSRREKAAILATDPANLIAGLASGVGVVDPEVCGASCGATCAGSCAASCAGSCGGTCAGSCQSSCGATCGGSCGASCDSSCAGSCGASCAGSGDCGASCLGSGGIPEPGETVVLPAEALNERIMFQVLEQLSAVNFTRYTR